MLPAHKTKIVATIGPASSSPQVLEGMIAAGMSVARINFSHGDFAGHRRAIEMIRAASRRLGRKVSVMADLPGPKIRIGSIEGEPVELKAGDAFTLTSGSTSGSARKVSVTFAGLARAVRPGETLFLNDGLVELEVTEVEGEDVHCRVLAGGELGSGKGLNLPGIDLGITAFTDRDRECLRFALEQGVDAVSQSFVESAADVEAVREAAATLGHSPFLVAKIERAGALERLEEIVEAADAIMVARGDLGVEVPIEKMAVIQKDIMALAVCHGTPVITATQMLESMSASRRPTRAEATDVANAVLDGTDCVMLSAESAVGRYPVESVAMLARIAAATEGRRAEFGQRDLFGPTAPAGRPVTPDLIAESVAGTLEKITPSVIFVPTVSGATARNVARFRLPVWIAAVSPRHETCQDLQFSCGVWPVCEPEYPHGWNGYVRDWARSQGLGEGLAVLTEGPSTRNPDANHRMEIIDLGRGEKSADSTRDTG